MRRAQETVARSTSLISEGLLSVRQAAALTGLSRKYIYSLLWARELGYVRLRGRVRIPRSELDQFLAARFVAASCTQKSGKPNTVTQQEGSGHE